MEDPDAPHYIGSKDLLLGWSQRWLGKEQEAQTSFKRGRDKVENALVSLARESYLHQRLARLLAGMKDEAGALAEVEKAIALTTLPSRREDEKMTLGAGSRQDSAALLAKATVLAQLGRKNEAIGTLQEMARDEASGLDITPALLKLDPIWDPLRGEPSFEQLISELEQKTRR
jgi:serine/threonine-protein kinase